MIASFKCWAITDSFLGHTAIYMEGAQVSLSQKGPLKYCDTTNSMLKSRRLGEIVPESQLLLRVGLVK